MDTANPFKIPAGQPGYLYFATEDEALAAEAEITRSLGVVVGVNAATGQPDPVAQPTTRWAVPVPTDDGQWAIPAPPTE